MTTTMMMIAHRTGTGRSSSGQKEEDAQQIYAEFTEKLSIYREACRECEGLVDVADCENCAAKHYEMAVAYGYEDETDMDEL